MNHIKIVLYFSLLFSNNASLAMDWLWEHPKTVSLVVATTLLTALSRNYLFKVACKYNCYRIVKLCNPNNWWGYKIIDYNNYNPYAGEYEDGFHRSFGARENCNCMLFDWRMPLEVALWYRSEQATQALLSYPGIFEFNDGVCHQRISDLIVTSGSQQAFEAYKKSEIAKHWIFAHQADNIASLDHQQDNYLNNIFYAQDTLKVAQFKVAFKKNDFEQLELLCSDDTIKDAISPNIARRIIDLSIQKNSPNIKAIIECMLKYVHNPTQTLLSILWDISFSVLNNTKINYNDIVDFLLHHKDMDINAKYYEDYSFFQKIFRYDQSILQHKTTIINLMNRAQNLHFQKGMFYWLCQHYFDLSKITFINSLSFKDKKELVHTELDLLEEGEIAHGKEFFTVFLEYGGDLNRRRKNGNRALEITEKLSLQEIPLYENRRSLLNTYHFLLQKTPYISDGGLLIILMQQLNKNKDMVRKIMGYHTALNLDRYISRCSLDTGTPNLNYKRKSGTLTHELCQQYGYLNPLIDHGDDATRKWLAIT